MIMNNIDLHNHNENNFLFSGAAPFLMMASPLQLYNNCQFQAVNIRTILGDVELLQWDLTDQMLPTITSLSFITQRPMTLKALFVLKNWGGFQDWSCRGSIWHEID